MSGEILYILLTAIVLVIIIACIDSYSKHKGKRIDMSFREAMDLVELPVITFCNKDKKLNFLLDTGSTTSQINSSILPLLDHKVIEGKSIDVIGIEGNKVKTQFCEMAITYKGQEFIDEFCIHNLDDAFAIVKEESGVQIHGILGSKFFEKYRYILDFSSLVAYIK